MTDDIDDEPLPERRLTQKEVAREYRKAAYQKAKAYHKAQKAKRDEKLANDPELRAKLAVRKSEQKERARKIRSEAYAKAKARAKVKKGTEKQSQRDEKNKALDEQRQQRDAELWDTLKPAKTFPPLRLVKDEE